MRPNCLAIALVEVVVGTSAALAQSTISVRGVVYDSLHSQPLAGAFIAVVGTSRTAVTDSQGTFRLDSIVPGEHRFVIEHDVLEAIGMSGSLIRVAVTSGRDTVKIGLPSFATLWNAACGPSTPPSDSGFIYGTVIDADLRKAVASAQITLSWIDLGYQKNTGVVERRWTAETRSDSAGQYTVCGVPTETDLDLVASKNTFATGQLSLKPVASRIQRRDLMLGSASSSLGAVAGTLRDVNGQPVSAGRVIVDSLPEVRSDVHGRFFVTKVPAGTRQIRVLTAATEPAAAIVDVGAHDTAVVSVTLEKISLLTPVSVSSDRPSVRQRWASELEERRQRGWGTFFDSTTIMRYPSAITMLTMVSNIGRVCAYVVDGIVLPDDPPGEARRQVAVRNSADFWLIEIEKGPAIPPEFRGRKCGKELNASSLVVLIWTKLGR